VSSASCQAVTKSSGPQFAALTRPSVHGQQVPADSWPRSRPAPAGSAPPRGPRPRVIPCGPFAQRSFRTSAGSSGTQPLLFGSRGSAGRGRAPPRAVVAPRSCPERTRLRLAAPVSPGAWQSPVALLRLRADGASRRPVVSPLLPRMWELRENLTPCDAAYYYRRLRVTWVTPLGLFTASIRKRSSSASSPSQSRSPRPSTTGTTTMCT